MAKDKSIEMQTATGTPTEPGTPVAPAPAGFDLANLDTTANAEVGENLEIEHPTTGDKLGPVITLAGADSGRYRRAQTAISSRRKGKRVNKITPEDVREEGTELLARCTLGWTGVVLDGTELPFSLENTKMLYTRFPWIREQVDGFIHERSNYLQD